MARSGWYPTIRVRSVLALMTLLGVFAAATGLPLREPASSAPDLPYPCRDRACGCRTAELCWQGDCCCFTLEEKVAWADRRGVALPESIRAKILPQRPKAKPCCCEESPAFGDAKNDRSCKPAAKPAREWTLVLGVSALLCRGQGDWNISGCDWILGDPPLEVPAATTTAFSAPRSVPWMMTASDAPPIPPPRHVQTTL